MTDRRSAAQHEVFMRRAIELARNAPQKDGAAPIGCVIVRDGQIIGEGSNEVGPQCDPTAHAEIVSIRRACERLGSPDLSNTTLYSTLQPCGMCSMASIWAKVGTIVFGAERHQVHKMYFEDRHFDTMDFINDAFRDDLEVIQAVLSNECAKLYYRPTDNPPE